MTPRSLCIILPVFNEEVRLGPALDELFAYLCSDARRNLPQVISVLVVDDGSTDGTAALVKSRGEFVPDGQTGLDRDCAGLRLLGLPHAGKGSAVRAGMLAAQEDDLVFADADMATPPDQLIKLIAALREDDIALGSRIQPDGSDMRRSQPPLRRLLGRAFRFAVGLWVVGHVPDTQCGFKGFRREVAHDLFGLLRITSIVFDVDLIYLARRRGYRVAIVPVIWSDRRGSRMRARPRLALRVGWDLFRIRFIHRGVGKLADLASAPKQAG